MTLFGLLCFGVVIHLIFLISIFDIYFMSPIIPDISPEPNTLIPLGKRVVLFSVDGLRVDSLFDKYPDSGEYVAKHMQNIIKNKGSWGVSQTHLPTESRPGHVAMLAGFYEDPSAVTRGWKENPVSFDSVFNRSYCSFAWGSSEILNIFFKGLKHNCAFMESYSDEQNFAGDTKKYDTWVYNKFSKFMKFSHESRNIHEEGIFFFLHLLGQDTSGHSDKPHTRNYRSNLKNVDEIVKKIEKIFYDFYGDDKTTFIFTSDHGMTDWGSHGAGDPEEINTPFVAWGAGIKKPSTPPKKINIEQADITPLLAILLGSSIPVNSIGVLPIMYLNMSKKQIAEGIFLNARQISAQFLKALENTEKHIIPLFHIPFRITPDDVNSQIWAIEDLIRIEKYSEAILSSKNLIINGLNGLEYYQNYYQKHLLCCISLSYLAWILYLLLELFAPFSLKTVSTPKLKVIFYVIFIITLWILTIQRLPISFYFYVFLPEFLWYLVLKKVWSLQSVIEKMNIQKCLYFFLFVMLGIEILVISFFYRWFLCLSMVIVLLWSNPFVSFKEKKKLKVMWLASGSAVALFPLLPIVGGQPNPFLTASSGICLCFLSFSVFLLTKKISTISFVVKFVALAFSIWNNFEIHSYFNEYQELFALNQYVSWILLFVSISILILGEGELFEKLHEVFMSLTIPFLLLSIKHEGYFLFFFYIHLFCWIFVESSSNPQDSLINDFRIAYFFLVYILISFFGLGNTSSVNSFDPAWVRCFLTVFAPFLMAALILFKTIIPFLVVTCTMRIITVLKNIQPGRLFLIVLIYCNIMGLNFLFFVKNKGSWLDIGTSVSRYVIQQVTTVFLVVLFGIAKLLTNDKREKKGKANGFGPQHNFSLKTDQLFSLPTFYSFSKQHNL